METALITTAPITPGKPREKERGEGAGGGGVRIWVG
jgi:hypothetical protein